MFKVGSLASFIEKKQCKIIFVVVHDRVLSDFIGSFIYQEKIIFPVRCSISLEIDPMTWCDKKIKQHKNLHKSTFKSSIKEVKLTRLKISTIF